jgi:hypothetical protein
MSRSGALGSCPHCEGFLYIERENPAAAVVKKPAPKKTKSTRPIAAATA